MPVLSFGEGSQVKLPLHYKTIMVPRDSSGKLTVLLTQYLWRKCHEFTVSHHLETIQVMCTLKKLVVKLTC